MTTGIIVALPEEFSTLSAKKIPIRGECGYISENILVAHSGTGPDNASKATQMLIDRGCCKIISWGCAAALDSKLNSGDLCLPKILFSEAQAQYPINAQWLEFTSELLNPLSTIHYEPVKESNHIVSTSAEKKDLFLSSNAVALDMESAAIARLTQSTGIPLLVIRVIADTADMNLPTAISHSVSDQGEINLKQLLISIAQKPSQIPELIKLGMNFYSARRTLKVIAGKLNDITQFTAHQKTQIIT